VFGRKEKKRNRSVYIGIDDDSIVRKFEWATVQQKCERKRLLDSERIQLGYSDCCLNSHVLN
jgi:hypothetical protein